MNGYNWEYGHPASSIETFQAEKLRETLHYVAQHSPFYSKWFKRHRVDIESIRTPADLSLIPPTEKQDLQMHNQDFICVPEYEIIDYVTTSGTLGEPVTFVLTDRDLDRLAYNEFRSMEYTGLTRTDKVQLTVTLDKRFMAGLAYFSGLRKLGTGIVRVGPGNPELQWDTITRVGSTALVAVPSFVLRLIEYAEQKGIDYRASSIRKIICIGEPIRNQDFSPNEIGRKILQKWPVQLHSTYASTEMSTAFTECALGQGGHAIPELVIVECLDEYNHPVPPGMPGELTITTLGIEGMPLIRFKTGDIMVLHHEACPCGCDTLRVGPILGRKNHMIKYKGTTLYPPALNDILNSIDEVVSYFIQVYTNDLGTDELVAHVFARNPGDALEKQIKDTFRAKLRVAPALKFVSKEEIEIIKFSPSRRKPVDFVDHRTTHTYLNYSC
jgi:phenylacetate-CoA ligase